jgi:ABC-type cobalamin transport system ATPase subunit
MIESASNQMPQHDLVRQGRMVDPSALGDDTGVIHLVGPGGAGKSTVESYCRTAL